MFIRDTFFSNPGNLWPPMENRYLIRTDTARLLADKVAPDFNFEDQLWFIARADPHEALEYLHLLLRTQFFVRAQQDGESFFQACSIDYLGTFSRVVAASKLPNLVNGTKTDTNVDSPTPRR